MWRNANLAKCNNPIYLSQPSVAFHTETSSMNGFYMKCNTGLRFVTGKNL